MLARPPPSYEWTLHPGVPDDGALPPETPSVLEYMAEKEYQGMSEREVDIFRSAMAPLAQSGVSPKWLHEDNLYQ